MTSRGQPPTPPIGYCTQCGSPLAKLGNSCTSCGASSDQAANPSSPPHAPARAEPQDAPNALREELRNAKLRSGRYQLKSATVFLAVWLIPTALVVNSEWGPDWQLIVTASAFLASIAAVSGME